MFGDLFEEDCSSVSNNQYGKRKKLKTKALEPPAPREFTNLSGIRNQGGTCYLNSLLQTLHFTPEFREALFSLGPEELGSLEEKDNPDAKVRIIPLQLQRLFAQLLLLDQEVASTADLTDSFGWTSNEEMRQHDVQELNRILFSALETSLVGTSGHDLINRLYHGTIVNQIVCKECKNVSEKQEDFLDLTVAVKNVSGLEDALWNMYVEEEIFDSDNLYHCGACDRLVGAAKLEPVALNLLIRGPDRALLDFFWTGKQNGMRGEQGVIKLRFFLRCGSSPAATIRTCRSLCSSAGGWASRVFQPDKLGAIRSVVTEC